MSENKICHVMECGPFRVEVGPRVTPIRDSHISALCEDHRLTDMSISGKLLIMALAAGDGRIKVHDFRTLLERSSRETPESIFFKEPNLEARAQAFKLKSSQGSDEFFRRSLPGRIRTLLRETYKDGLFYGLDAGELISFPTFDAYFLSKEIAISSVHLDAWKNRVAAAHAAATAAGRAEATTALSSAEAARDRAAQKRRAAISAVSKTGKSMAPRV